MKNLKKILIAFCFSFFVLFSPSQLVAQDELEHPTETFKEQARCLALNLAHEARGEPLNGIVAVAQTTINRTKAKNFPDTICEVVYQKNQFSWTKSKQKKISTKDYQKMYTISVAVMNGEISNNKFKRTLYFHNTQVVPNWSYKFKRVAQVGNHVFYSL